MTTSKRKYIISWFCPQLSWPLNIFSFLFSALQHNSCCHRQERSASSPWNAGHLEWISCKPKTFQTLLAQRVINIQIPPTMSWSDIADAAKSDFPTYFMEFQVRARRSFADHFITSASWLLGSWSMYYYSVDIQQMRPFPWISLMNLSLLWANHKTFSAHFEHVSQHNKASKFPHKLKVSLL